MDLPVPRPGREREQVRGREGERAGSQLAFVSMRKRLPLWAVAVGTSRMGWTSAPIPSPLEGHLHVQLQAVELARGFALGRGKIAPNKMLTGQLAMTLELGRPRDCRCKGSVVGVFLATQFLPLFVNVIHCILIGFIYLLVISSIIT